MKALEFKNHPIHQKILELKAREHQTAQKETHDDSVKNVPFELIDKLFKLIKS